MVRAILEGRKTQTRRIVKFPVIDRDGFGCEIAGNELNSCLRQGLNICRVGQVGDRLWVKETFTEDFTGPRNKIVYRADDPEANCKWKSKLFMSRKQSRITLEIVSVRAEKLNDISEKDAKAEGVSPIKLGFLDARDAGRNVSHSYLEGYGELWESINGQGSWNKNPRVWAIEFKKL